MSQSNFAKISKHIQTDLFIDGDIFDYNISMNIHLRINNSEREIPQKRLSFANCLDS